MSSLFSDVCVVIRSSGERTESFCFKFLSEIFNDKNITIVREIPFTSAIKKTFEVGISSEKKWLLCIDADVLISEEGIEELLIAAHSSGKEVFELQGLVLDKFLPIFRPAGNHIYRIAYCNKAIRFISNTLRPESDMLNKMALKNFPWVQTPIIVGIHDFEQSFEDILRKNYLQGIKHRKFIKDLLPHWISKSEERDFTIALKGAEAGLCHKGRLDIDKNHLSELVSDLVGEILFEEKDTLAKYPNVSKLIENHKKINDPFFSGLQDRYFPLKNWSKTYTKEIIKSKLPPPYCSRIKTKLIKLAQLINFTNDFKT